MTNNNKSRRSVPKKSRAKLSPLGKKKSRSKSKSKSPPKNNLNNMPLYPPELKRY